MRPRDMTVTQGSRGGFRVTFENDRELVTIEASAERLNAWARVLAARTAAVDDGSTDPVATGSGKQTPG